MPRIDWLYRRNGCNTCKKADAFLAEMGISANTVVDARREPYDRTQTLALVKQVKRIVAAKGTKVVELDLKTKPDEATILGCVLGPTGNLRAPTARVGSTLLVGFHPDMYRTWLK